MNIFNVIIVLFLTVACARMTIFEERSTIFEKRYALMTSEGRPGFQILTLKNAAVFRKSSFGFADVKNKILISEATQFRLASMTKAFTAAVSYLLEKDQKLKSSISIRRYLPELPERFENITVGHLINHTSGLPDFGVNCEILKSPGKFYSNSDVLNWIKTKGPKFKAGERYEYSNTGYIVLASILERVSASNFPDMVNEKIFRPLHMKDSFFISQTNDGLSPNQAKAYGAWPEMRERLKNSCDYTYGEDGIFTTISDFAKWATYVETLIPEYPFTNDYVYGWVKGSGFYDHSGSWMGFRSYARWYPEKDIWILILGNFSDLPMKDIITEAQKEVLQE